MLKLIRDIYRRRELLWMLVSRNLKIRYKNSSLGFLWTLLGPLFMILIYATFAKLLKWNDGNPHYLQFLIVGIVVWQFLLMCLNDSLNSIMGNANLVKKTAFPRIILPLSMVVANLVNFLMTSVILIIYIAVVGISFSHLELFPLLIISQCALCLGMSLIICTSNVFFRDTEHILGIITLAWFFLSPVFYTVSRQTDIMPAGFSWLVFANPISGILCAYRYVLMSEGCSVSVVLSFAMSWIILFVGIGVFQKYQAIFGDEL